MSNTRQNKVVQAVQADINTHTKMIPVALKLAKSEGVVRGDQANNTLAIFTRFAIGGVTTIDASTDTPEGEGLYQYLASPSTVKGIKVADRQDFLEAKGSSMATSLYNNWANSAMKECKKHGTKAVAQALNKVEQQRVPFLRMVDIFLRGTSGQKARLVKELSSKDAKRSLKRLHDLLATITEEIVLHPSNEGGHYTETKEGKELSFPFSIQQIMDRKKVIQVADKKHLEAMANDNKVLSQQLGVLNNRHSRRLNTIMEDGRTTSTSTETRVRPDLDPQHITNALEGLDGLLQEVHVQTQEVA